MNQPIETVLAALRDCDCGPKRSGAGWTARCPAHDDYNPSLSIGVGEDGRVLVNCHTGCKTSDVLKAIGLTQADLFSKPSKNGVVRRKNRSSLTGSSSAWASLDDAVAEVSRSKGRPSAIWTYEEKHGKSVGAVLRWDRSLSDKEILPLRSDLDGWRMKAMQAPRNLYNLPSLLVAPEGETVLFVEGEKCADAATACGLVATTTAGGCKAAGKSNFSPLAEKNIVILPDHDDAGEKYADDASELALKAGATSVRIVRLVELWPDMPKGGDLADMVGEDGPWGGWADEDIRTAIESLAAKTESISAIVAAPPRFVPFPTDALPEPVRSYVAAGAQSIGCDASYIALPMLSALASAIGDSRAILLKRIWIEPAVIWTAIVGESGTQKTPAFKYAARAVRTRQRRLMKEHAEAMQAWEADDLRHQSELAKWKKKATNKGDTTEPPEAPEMPICPRAWIEDCTTEKLASLLKENPRGLLMLRNELSGWFSFGQYKNGGGAADVARWLQMFDADELMVDRIGSGTTSVPRAAVSLAGGIQPETLRRALGQEHRDNGLLARLLLTYPPRRAKRWTEADVDPLLESDVSALFDRLYDLEPDVDRDGDPTPRLIALTPEAKAMWIAFVNEHGQEQIEHFGDEAAAWSKLEGYAARFSLVIHLVRSAAGDPTIVDPERVDEVSLKAGVTLVKWFTQETVRIYATMAEDDDARDRRQMTEQLERMGGSVSVREWQRARSHRKAADAEAELSKLVDEGVGRWEERAPGPKGGRPSRRFVLGMPTPVSDTTAPVTVEGGPVGRESVVSSVLSVSETGVGAGAAGHVGKEAT